ncbi:nicotinate-nucleotide--dimethylbenzimidazole phosphoribosyltransferase [Prosthecochloris sp. N3]|uniref:Nicotinate-nucleotide--dimethylbenzimidazole phosphoribosyltransferase n=1 Tax=Prosthecochloris ethylica TaxID=2743976 RepID=A0ABR9XUN1_9CHLB|nr:MULTISPECIES: nicotinate-nucleotide--dimethylbenzimidazole phosphoribosyltransferase [Prosthecochloris]MBF0587268.1 nicotinate-nucleotide--dimethylbenzimidazole phosphoribosyltransferase [Prosthecochloris ethylica]MBF0637510.1 nicotinate-nucleotide--dimethylbenzimidazole phosphoribosyltransferase [Prosthecochloris ethylica]NUK48076.1 nicotinate-nucleotide--dimethylbenzimidazole phosphoribosyltransferase [Prosthecochloris ethylica]RNA66100.1 nicotinate-nucleotide--dimethylbenzimidazole phosph
MIDQFQNTLSSIKGVDMSLSGAVQAHLDDLTKPKGSLGRLEEIVMKYALARGTDHPVLKKKKVFCFAADHGVAAEGVSAFPAEVTPQMVYNMLHGGAAINALASHAGADLDVVDMGVNHDFDEHPALRRHKVRKGSANMAKGPAMTMEETLQAVMVGVALAREAHAEGYDLLATGEMGIANTTPATALYASLLDLPVEMITGRGTGIDDVTLGRKISVIKQALEVNAGQLSTPLEKLAALGGFEIAGICGLVLGAASVGLPVVVDGFISSAGAVAALKMSCGVSDYLFFSHLSREQGHKTIMNRLGARPILDLDLRLGEGTGAALAMQVIEASVRVYDEMATFSSANVSDKSV